MNAIASALVALGVRRAQVVDTEFKPVPAGMQIPHCLCSIDLISGERRDIWLTPGMPCPFEMAKDELFVMWAADADALTFIAMGWPTPVNVIDPRVEWIRIDNGGNQFKPGSNEKKGYGLLDAARAFHLPAIPQGIKKHWRDIAIRGAPFTAEEKAGLVRYCRDADVDLTVRVLAAMWDASGLSDRRTFHQALIRGRFMAAAARCYVTGIPLDMSSTKFLIRHAGEARLGLIASKAGVFPVYRSDGSFSHKLFAELLRGHHQLARWPRTPTGNLSTSDAAFEMMSEIWPLGEELNRFRGLLDQLRTFDLPIGNDGRARAQLRAFGTKTSRNNTAKGGEFIFARNAVFRHLIQPPRGRALILVDYSAQELHIAARRSRDPKLIEIVRAHAVEGKDPYVQLAIAVGLAPEGATEESDPKIRGTGKIIQLAMLYGAGPGLVAQRTGMTLDQARAFLKRQRETFRRFFAWSDRKAMKAVTGQTLSTPLGWTIRFRHGTTTRSPERTGRNFCIQGLAADMMRLLMIRLSEAGLATCAAIHDGFLIECADDQADAVHEIVKAAMDRSAIDLIGATIPIKSRIFRWPESYQEGKTDARELFEVIMKVVREAEQRTKIAASG
jgi:DNA polymerase I